MQSLPVLGSWEAPKIYQICVIFHVSSMYFPGLFVCLLLVCFEHVCGFLLVRWFGGLHFLPPPQSFQAKQPSESAISVACASVLH